MPRSFILTTFCVAATFAATLRADTFRIELDQMHGGGHTHSVSQLVLDAVINIFACQGHTLMIDADFQSPHSSGLLPEITVLRRDPDDCSASLFEYDGPDSFGELRDHYFDHQDDDEFWHYGIMAHQYEDENCQVTTSSGLGERPGRYFVVTLGAFEGQTGTVFEQAATLAHEFGHNLGLTHCGEEDCAEDGDYVPVYASIMSYRYQLGGVRAMLECNGLIPPEAVYKDLDYSGGRMCGVSEHNLNEFDGSFMMPVDWNCNGILESSVAKDISSLGSDGNWCSANGNLSFVSDENDWGDIHDVEMRRMRGSLPPPREEPCITAEEWNEVKQEMNLRGGCRPPSPTLIACVANNYFVGPFNIYQAGTCDSPYLLPSIAQDAALPESAIFVKPGTYVHGGLTLDKPATWMCNTGLATIK